MEVQLPNQVERIESTIEKLADLAVTVSSKLTTRKRNFSFIIAPDQSSCTLPKKLN